MLDKLLVLQNNKELILHNSLEKLTAISGLRIKFGFEIEFYIRPLGDKFLDDSLVKSFLSRTSSGCRDIELFDGIDLEKGEFQCEFRTKPYDDVGLSLDQINLIVKEIERRCKELEITSIYDPRPFLDDCGSAFQVSFSLIDDRGDNALVDGALSAKIADFITSHIDELLIFCNEKDEDFDRYKLDYNKSIFKKGKFVAPTSKSWGYDNRTCALRVLSPKGGGDLARIELRLPSNNCDKHLLLCAITLLLHEFFALEEHVLQKDAVYGNSFDEKYVQHKFPMNYSQALEGFSGGEVLYAKMMEIIEAA